MEEIILKCKENIQLLLQKYESDPYMFQRIQYHLSTILPATLENESKNHIQRITRTHFLMNEQQIFIQVFLSKNQYYYLPNNGCFYHYNGNTYSTITEDDILHQLLTSISKDRTLMQWKYKTKNNIIKQIKERNLFISTPESDTFQKVLHVLYPTFFSNKQEAKYFLTILGDNILKKNSDLIFLIKPKTRKFINEIENIAYYNIGITNIANNLITKYHENYTYDKCRLLKINDVATGSGSLDIWTDILKKTGLDLLCVAAHYSNRYTNSDSFINNYVNEDLRNYAFYLKNNSQDKIINHFCNYSIVPANAAPMSLNWKNIHYIWKLYISHFSYPNMIYASSLKNLLKEQFSYDEETDSFKNITSKYLPLTSDFILFWEKTITVLEESLLEEEEFEIDEICSLFKKWTHENTSVCITNGNISEHDAVKLISHFFPAIEIIDNKYILNITSSMWDKNKEIQHILDKLKSNYNTIPQSADKELSLISLDYAYQFYCEMCNKIKIKIVSKRYFEKYVSNLLSSYIVFDNFISFDWFNN